MLGAVGDKSDDRAMGVADLIVLGRGDVILCSVGMLSLGDTGPFGGWLGG